MMGRIIGGVLGSAIGRDKGRHPVAGAAIGAVSLFAARRLFPQRYAVIAATAAAAYLTKKWADRAEARRASGAADPADPDVTTVGVIARPAGTNAASPPISATEDDGERAAIRP